MHFFVNFVHLKDSLYVLSLLLQVMHPGVHVIRWYLKMNQRREVMRFSLEHGLLDGATQIKL